MEFDSDGYASYGGLAYDTMDPEQADVLLLGIPYEAATSGKKGTSFAPSALRAISADMQTMTRTGINLDQMALRDLGDIPVYPLDGKKTRDSVAAYFSHALSAGAPLVSFGGDHSLTYPLLKALSSQGSIGVIWFDAHRDLLDELLGSRHSHGSSLRRSLELENINPENVFLVGTRYITQSEQQVINDLPISEMKKADMEQLNWHEVMQEFVKKIEGIASRVDFIYVSIDIDVLDPAFAPGTGTPVAAGLSSSELVQMVSAIPARVRAFDIMEVSPPLDCSGITVKAMMGLLTEILGQIKTTKEQ